MRSISLVVLLILGLPAPAWADAVVLEVRNTPGLVAGEEIKSGKSILIPRGGSVKIWRDDNVPLVLEGPYSGRVPKGGKKLALFQSIRDALLGSAVLRSAEAAGSHYRFLDLSSGGIKCGFAEGGGPTLWLPPPASPTSLTLSLSGDPETIVNWPQGQSQARWPAQVRLVDGASYVAQVGSGNPLLFQLKLAPAMPARSEQHMAWLARSKCAAQLEMLIQSLPALSVKQ